MTKIGIDLSTKNFGYAIIVNNVLIEKGKIDFLPYGPDNLEDNIDRINCFFNDTKWLIKYKSLKDYKENEIYLGIELGNFSNPDTTQKFSYYAGIISSIYFHTFNYNNNIKMFNANEWFQHLKIPSFTTLERAERKRISISFANYKNAMDFHPWNDDESDAYCVAYFLEKCLDSSKRKEQTKENIKQYKKRIANNKKERAQAQKLKKEKK